MGDVQAAEWARAVVVAAWRAETGREPSLFEAQCVQALTQYETRWGSAWTGECVNSHNWGSVHATAADVKAGRPTCEHSDTYPDGTRYAQRFLMYPDDVRGCRDVVRLMLRAAGAELAAGVSTDDVWRALFYGRYYGAHCPEAIKAFGPSAAADSFSRTGKMPTTAHGQACDDECIRQGQDTAAAVVRGIAQTLGEEPAPTGRAESGGSSPDGSALLVGLLVFGGLAAWAASR